MFWQGLFWVGTIILAAGVFLVPPKRRSDWKVLAGVSGVSLAIALAFAAVGIWSAYLAVHNANTFAYLLRTVALTPLTALFLVMAIGLWRRSQLIRGRVLPA